MCHCREVELGTYENTVIMVYDAKLVSIDTCIATEIGYLWHQGVKTLNSCCGHGELTPSVIVAPESIERMRALGYASVSSLRSVVPAQTFELRGCRGIDRV